MYNDALIKQLQKIKLNEDNLDDILNNIEDFVSKDESNEILLNKIKSIIPEDILVGLNPPEGEEWKHKEAIDKVKSLLNSALQNAENKFNDREVISLDETPKDLLKAYFTINVTLSNYCGAGDCKASTNGFFGAVSGGGKLIYAGKEVFGDQIPFIFKGQSGFVKNNKILIYDNPNDFYRGVGGKSVEFNKVERVYERFPAWMMNVKGNAVSIEHELKNLGFKDAFAGSPDSVRVRKMTKEELVKVSPEDVPKYFN